MHEIDDAIVEGGTLVLSHLPFADGQHVHVVVEESSQPPVNRISIGKIREILKGGVERFEDPLEPMIPNDDWEMLK